MTHKREIQGKVLRKSGDKTFSIVVERKIFHPRYKKTVKKFKKYLIHDNKNELDIGDFILAIECRPLSKSKKFRLKSILSKGDI